MSAFKSLPSALIVSLLFLLCACQNSTGVLIPYETRVTRIEPQLEGLSVRATSGGGGELEITNRSSEEVLLLDENNQPVARLDAQGGYEMRAGEWVRVREGDTFYWHDPRFSVIKPGGSEQPGEVMKEWQVSGTLGGEPFTVSGETIYTGDGDRSNFSILLLCAGAAGSAGLIAVILLVFLWAWNRTKKGREHGSS